MSKGWSPYAGYVPPTRPETMQVTSSGAVRGRSPWPSASAPPVLDIGGLPDLGGRALCAEVDSGDLFFPDKGGSNAPAKAICGRCEVREACLAWALEHDERDGVWGGMGSEERREIRRRWAS